jgi:hypothetical protein
MQLFNVNKYQYNILGVVMWKDVDEFAQWYKDNNHPFKPQALDGIYVTENVYGTCIFRRDRFQVELCYMKPNWSTVNLTSPGIDQRILFLHGSIKGIKDGKVVFDTDMFSGQTTETGASILYNRIFKAGALGIDTLEVGPQGASLMLIQHWEEGIPMTSVSRQKNLALN